jgi:hypothetical protein
MWHLSQFVFLEVINKITSLFLTLPVTLRNFKTDANVKRTQK